jgi:uncharacterized protein (DUF1778 family)
MMETASRQLGRNPKPVDERRSESFRFRLSIQERRALIAAAERLGKPISEFIRVAALREALNVETVATRIYSQADK